MNLKTLLRGATWSTEEALASLQPVVPHSRPAQPVLVQIPLHSESRKDTFDDVEWIGNYPLLLL